jgi:excisionase family DNA binding protein
MSEQNPTQEAPLLLRRPEAARLLGIGKTKLLELIEAGKLEQVILHEGGWPRIRRSDVERLARGEQPDREAAP